MLFNFKIFCYQIIFLISTTFYIQQYLISMNLCHYLNFCKNPHCKYMHPYQLQTNHNHHNTHRRNMNYTANFSIKPQNIQGVKFYEKTSPRENNNKNKYKYGKKCYESKYQNWKYGQPKKYQQYIETHKSNKLYKQKQQTESYDKKQQIEWKSIQFSDGNQQNCNDNSDQEDNNNNQSVKWIEMNAKLNELGFKNMQRNVTLLNYFDGDYDVVYEALMISKHKCNNILEQINQQSKINFFIIKQIGFSSICDKQIWKIVLKYNKLSKIIQKLQKISRNNQKKQAYKHKLCNLQFIHHFSFIHQIPLNTYVVIDVFNVTPTNKHLRKLFKSINPLDNLEAFIRLRIFVETLFQGVLVYDKQIFSSQIEQQLENSLQIKLEASIKMKRIYAEPNQTADQKIIELFKMISGKHESFLLVTEDNELIQLCFQICGNKLNIMKGDTFLKCAKKMHPKNIRHQILKSNQNKQK